MATTRSQGAVAIERELIREGLAAICEEMAVSVLRTSHSETVKSAMDFSTALCNANGEIIAQGVTLPNQLGAIPDAVDAILTEFEGNLLPGDIVMVNDPFAGGMHLPDIFVVQPVFVDSELVGLVATVAHHADLGGLVAGSMSPYAEECYQEGLRIPPVKLYSNGRPDHGMFAILAANTRVPEILLGDFAAQVVACETGEQGLVQMIRKYGLADFSEHVISLLDYTEELTKSEIRTFPEGVYSFVDYMDDDGIRPDLIPIAVTVVIRDGAVAMDFEGSAPQVRASLNSTLSFTKSNSYAAMRTLLQTDIPNNAGFFRPISVRAPRGSIVNCVLPAATATRGLTGFRVLDAIFGALAPALPDRVMGASDGGLSLVTMGGTRPSGERFSVVELLSGAWGGQALHDGQEGVPNLGANVSNIPVEMLESSVPVRIDRYGYVPDTGGSGQHRGGLSIEREYTFLGESQLSVRSDRSRVLPYGIGGGRPGTPSQNLLETDGDENRMPSKFSQRVTTGDRFYHRTAGAGGWGDPLARDPQAVADDVRNGILSAEHAFEEYGVIVDPATFEIDKDGSNLERANRKPLLAAGSSGMPTPLSDRSNAV
jgi:N-methylhydantoinase B